MTHLILPDGYLLCICGQRNHADWPHCLHCGRVFGEGLAWGEVVKIMEEKGEEDAN